jgi:hypothetical protein
MMTVFKHFLRSVRKVLNFFYLLWTAQFVFVTHLCDNGTRREYFSNNFAIVVSMHRVNFPRIYSLIRNNVSPHISLKKNNYKVLKRKIASINFNIQSIRILYFLFYINLCSVTQSLLNS